MKPRYCLPRTMFTLHIFSTGITIRVTINHLDRISLFPRKIIVSSTRTTLRRNNPNGYSPVYDSDVLSPFPSIVLSREFHNMNAHHCGRPLAAFSRNPIRIFQSREGKGFFGKQGVAIPTTQDTPIRELGLLS